MNNPGASYMYVHISLLFSVGPLKMMRRTVHILGRSSAGDDDDDPERQQQSIPTV